MKDIAREKFSEKKLNFVLIGAKSSGKTIYLVSLYLNIPNIRVKDSQTLEYLKPLAKKLKEDKNLPATSSGLVELFFEYTDEEYTVEFEIDDYDGKFVESFHTDDDRDFKIKLEKYIKHSEGIIFFIPYETSSSYSNIINVREEIDLFIEKVREMYKDRKKLPIPTVIAVTKWDLHPSFRDKDGNETEEAIAYLESSHELKNIKEKIELFFNKVTIVPISSYENYNLLKPLKFCIQETFKLWEEKIKNLQESEKKEELLVFLKAIYSDIKLYKEGIYAQKYKEIEQEIFVQLKREFGEEKDIRKLEEKLEKKRRVIDALVGKHKKYIEDIVSKKRKSEKRNKVFKIVGGFVVLIIVVLFLVFTFQSNERSKKERILYSKIEAEYKNGNYDKALEDAKIYLGDFKGYPHYREVVSIQSKIVIAYNKKIEKLKEEMKKAETVSDKEKISNEIANMGEKIGLNSEEDESEYNSVKEAYEEGRSLINSLTIDNLDKEIVERINNDIAKLEGYKDKEKLEKEFKNKIYLIISSVLEAQDYDQIGNIYNLLPILNLDEYSRDRVVEAYKRLSLENEFNNLVKELEYKNFFEAEDYVSLHWNEDFDDTYKARMVDALNNKLDAEVRNILEKMPDRVKSVDDVYNLEDKIDKIEKMLESGVEVINYRPKLSEDIEEKFEKRKELYKEYSDWEYNPSYVVFSASSEDNEPLGFKCYGMNSDDDIVMIVTNVDSNGEGMVYSYKEENVNCKGLSIKFQNYFGYKEGNYKIKIIEKDPVSDDVYLSHFTVDKDDIVRLKNRESIEKDLGRGYKITLEP